MGEAFDAACNELHDKGQPTVVYDVIAKRIIDAAKNGERDQVKLRNIGLAGLGFDKEAGQAASVGGLIPRSSPGFVIAQPWRRSPLRRCVPKMTTPIANWFFAVVHVSQMLNALKANHITLLGTVRGRGMRHEAPAPIDQKAQPAAPGRSL
jgi:hypothetical protein